jgi:hypothetical protein
MERWRYKCENSGTDPFISEVHQILLKILELCAIELREPGRHVRCQVAESELPLVMMAVVTPILLNMHLVGIKAVQRHARSVILFHQPFEEWSRLRAEVVHFRGCVTHHHQEAIQGPDLSFPLPTHG